MSLGLLLLGGNAPAAPVTYTKGSSGAAAHQFKNPCKVLVRADPGLVAGRTLFLEPRAYALPVTVTAAAGWKILFARYRTAAGAEITLSPPPGATARWQWTLPQNLAGLPGGALRPLLTVRFATLRLTPAGAPDYQEDIALEATLAPDLATLDANANLLPDQWEIQFLGALGPNSPDADPDRDGFSNLQEFKMGTHPQDFWNGQPPVLTIIGGNNQGDLPGRTLTKPLAVRVTNRQGTPRANAAVLFTIPSGGGLLSPVNGGRTNADGIAKAAFQLPNTVGATIRANAAFGGAQTPFRLTVGDPSAAVSAAPSDPAVSLQNGGAKAQITWTDLSDNETAYYIDRTENGVTWTRRATLPANAESYVDPGLTPGRGYCYRIIAHNDAP